MPCLNTVRYRTGDHFFTSAGEWKIVRVPSQLEFSENGVELAFCAEKVKLREAEPDTRVEFNVFDLLYCNTEKNW